MGTDIIYTVQFDDGVTYRWQWDEEHHNESYRELTTTFTYMFPAIRNHTITLDISNAVSTESYELLVSIEPNLETFVDILDIYKPKAVPLDVLFLVNRTSVEVLPPSVIWCDIKFDTHQNSAIDDTAFTAVTTDIDLRYLHVYTSDRQSAFPHIRCYNHISEKSYSTMIKLQEDFIAVLTSSANNNSAVKANEPVEIYLDMSEGSHASIELNWDEGTIDELNTHSSALTYPDTLTFYHTYTIPRSYLITCEMDNFHFHKTIRLPNYLLVQNTLRELDISYIENVVVNSTGIGDQFITLQQNPAHEVPTNVSCLWNISSDNIVDEFSYELSNGEVYSKPVRFYRSNVKLDHSFNVTCYNLVSELKIQITMNILEEVSGVNLTLPDIFVKVDENVILILEVSSGSHVKYTIDTGYSTPMHVSHPQLFGNSAPSMVTFSYPALGNYTPSVEAYNLISSVTLPTADSVAVQEIISDLNITASEEVILPPGTIEYEIISLSTQPDIVNMHCHIDYGMGHTSYEYIDSLVTGEIYTFTHTLPRTHIGVITATSTCGNMVSSTTISASTLVVLDEVLLSSLAANSSVIWGNETVMVLDIERFGLHACFEFDMGYDGNRTLYGSDDFCLDYINENVTYIETPYNEPTLVHRYIYPGRFNTPATEFHVTVFAFNHVNNQTISADVTVLDWPCVGPNITMPHNASDVANPMFIMRTQDISITPEVEVDCLKTQWYFSKWTVFSGANEKIAQQNLDQNATLSPVSYLYLYKDLEYGRYTIQYEAGMSNVIPVCKTVTKGYIEIVKTPLHAEYNNPVIRHPYNTTVSFDAISVSHDPDLEFLDKTDLRFIWSCKRQDEEFMGTSINLNSLAPRLIDDQGGCFGTGSGIFVQNEGIIGLNTYYMKPDHSYNIRTILQKDNREAEVTHQFYIEPAKTPNITIR